LPVSTKQGTTSRDTDDPEARIDIGAVERAADEILS